MNLTAQDIITSALRRLGVVASGETPTTDELNDGLTALNELIESWSVEDLMVPYRKEESFPLVYGQSSYTIGPGGDFNTERPVFIMDAFIRDAGGYDFALDIIRLKEWARQALKSTISRPQRMWYEQTYPLGTIRFDYRPVEGLTVFLYSLKPLTTFPDLTTEIDIPPEYSRALRWNLAGELADEYGRSISQILALNMAESKNMIISHNLASRMVTSEVDDGLRAQGRYFNIYRDTY